MGSEAREAPGDDAPEDEVDGLRAAAATSVSTAEWETCWARSATDFMVRTKSPGASSPTSRAATARAVEKEAPRAHEATAVARPGAGWRVRGTRCSSSTARMRSASTAERVAAPGQLGRRLSPSRSCSGAAGCFSRRAGGCGRGRRRARRGSKTTAERTPASTAGSAPARTSAPSASATRRSASW